MADEFNTEELLIKVTAEDDASKVLEQVDKNLKKFTDNEKKVEYLTKQLAKFEKQMQGVNGAIKKGQTVKFKEPLEKAISGTKKKLDILKPIETSTREKPKTLTPIEKEGEVYKTKVDEATKATKTWTKETVENGKKIVRTYGQIANEFGVLEEKHLSTETFYPKKLNRENILGDIVSEDAVRGVVTTQQIDENGKKIVRTYREAVKVGEKWQGVLASAKETQLKIAPPIARENLLGNIVSKDAVRGVVVTEQIDENGKKIVRTYKEAVKVGKKWQGVLASAKETQLKIAPPIVREDLLGNIVSEDAVRGVVVTEQINENGKKIVRTYREAKKEGEKWVGVLASAKETQLKMPPPLIRENLQGTLLSKNTTKGTAITEEIVKGKKVRRVYSDIMETSSGLVGVLKDENEVLSSNNKIWNKFSTNIKGTVKPFGRIGRIFQSIIAFRLASSVITLTMNAFKKGFEALKQSSKETNDLFLPFQTSLNSISISLATMVLPLIQSLTTILEPFAEKMTIVANSMSLVNAEAEGQSKYFKLSSDKIKEYTKSAQQANKQLSQLDKFATLSGNKTTPLGDWVEINEETKKQQEEENEKAKGLITAFKKVIDFIKNVINWFAKLDIQSLKTWGTIALVVFAVINPIGRVLTIAKLLANVFSKDVPIAVKVLSTALLGLIASLATLVILKDYLKGGWANALKASFFVGAITTGVLGGASIAKSLSTPTSSSSNTEQGYASSAINDIATANSQIPVNLTANVNMDGKRVGELTANSVRDTWKKNGWY